MNIFVAVMIWAAKLMLVAWSLNYYLNRRYRVTGKHAQPTPLLFQVLPIAAVLAERLWMKAATHGT